MRVTRTSFWLGSVEIRWYAVLIVLGMIAAVCLCARREKRFGFAKDTALDLALWAIPLGVIGARAYYVLFSLADYAARPAEIFDLRGGGLAIPGGVLGGALGVYVCSRVKKLSFAGATDLIAPGLALAQAVGRWGNFLNGEAYGGIVKSAALGFFPLAVDINGTPHYAAFFYESVWCALTALALLRLEGKSFFRRRGDGFLCYVFLYTLERAMLEGLREDSLMLGPLRVTQLVCVMLLIGVTACVLLRKGTAARMWRAMAILMTLVWAALTLFRPGLWELIPAALNCVAVYKVYCGTERKYVLCGT